MNKYLCFNGEIYDKTSFGLPLNDLGFQRGYGIYEYFKLIDNHNPWIDYYFERFFNSVKFAEINLTFTKDEILDMVSQVSNKNGGGTMAIKFIISGGFTNDGFNPSGHSNFVILSYPVDGAPEYGVKAGVNTITLNYARQFPFIKSTNYFFAVKAINEMKKHSAFEVIYKSNDLVLETTRANIFIVKDGKLITPDADVMMGITRRRIIDHVTSTKFCPLELRTVCISELYEADEVFLASSSKDALAITTIDNFRIGNGKVGDITHSLRNELVKF